MEWNRSESFGLSRPRCQKCKGSGLRVLNGAEDACPCVLRAIFRACYHRFVECVVSTTDAGQMAFGATRDRAASWSRKNEEFAADFLLVTRRTLTEEEYKIFKFRYLLGADWKLCCRKLKIDKGLYFHAIYRMQAKLGRTFRELEPYALFPINEYFTVNAHSETMSRKVVSIGPKRPSLSDSVPLKKVA